METLTSCAPVEFAIDYEFKNPKDLADTRCSLMIQTQTGEVVSRLTSPLSLEKMDHGLSSGYVVCRVANFPLSPGLVRLSVQLERGDEILDLVEDAYTGPVDAGGRYTKKHQEKTQGWVVLDGEWTAGSKVQ